MKFPNSTVLSINLLKGLYRYKKLLFGVTPAPVIFQQMMDTLFRGLYRVCVHIDDVLVMGQTKDDHILNLHG